MNLFSKRLRGRLLVVAFALTMLIGSASQLQAQLCTASCFPYFYYGCMSIASFTVNGTNYSNTNCGASDVGTTADNTNQSFQSVPGGTISWNMTAGYYYGSYYDGYYLIFVDWNNNNTWTQVSPAYSSNYMYQTTSGSFVVPANVTPGPKRMRVMFHYYYYYDYYFSAANRVDPCVQTNSSVPGYGDCKDFTLNIGYNNDAKLNYVSTTTAPPFTAGANNVVINFTNNGLNNITSAAFNYTATPSTGSPITGTATYSGTLTPGSSTSVTLLTNYNFPSVGSLNVAASVSSVNGGADGNTANNNASALLGAGLNGTYTVGGSSPDFTSPAQAASQLTAGGTIGAVTFNIRPGTYTENVYVGNIPGNSITKPIVFQSENGNKNSVILQYSNVSAAALTGTTSVGSTPTLRLNNADYITFKNFTIAALNTTSGLGIGIELIGASGGASGCDNVTFDNMVFNGAATTGTSLGDVFFLSVNSGYHPNLSVTNCAFNNASIPFYHVYASSTYPTGIVISNNTFSNFGYYATRLEGTQDATVSGNSWSSSSSALGAGVIFVNHNGAFNFRKNRVSLTSATSLSDVVSGSRSSSGQAIFANNFLRIAGTSGYGINSSASSNVGFFHNTIYSLTPLAAFTSSSATSIAVTNNIFINAGTGPAFAGVSGVVSNYNDIYAVGTTLATWNGTGYTTFASYKSASGQDAASANNLPPFVDQATNNLSLTIVNPLLYGIGSTSNGTYNSGLRNTVQDDIFGNNRSNRAEIFMGAHQLVPVISFNPAPPATLTGCANQTLTISANAVVTFGAQLSYSWQRNGAPLLDGVNGVSGASTNTLTITNAQPSLNGGDYVLRVTATGGADPLISNIISVTVNAPIVINQQPEARIICQGSETSMAVVASGTILGYQWQKDGVNIAGATGPILVINNAGFQQSGRYRVVMSGTCGTTTVASNDAAVVIASNTLIGTNPEVSGAAVGSTGYLSVEVNATAKPNGYSPSFQWYHGATKMVDDGRVSGVTTSQLTIRNMQTADITKDYYCVVTGICGSQSSAQGGFYVSQDLDSKPTFEPRSL